MNGHADIRLTASCSTLQGLYWILDVALLTYVTPFLEERGFTAMEIGVINGSRFAALILFQLWLGSYADRHAEQVTLKRILTLLAAGGAAAALALVILPNHFWTVLLCFAAIGMTMNSLLPMLESLSIQYLRTGEKLWYSFSRAVGSLAYSIFCIVMGIWTDRWGVEFSIRAAVPLFVLFIAVNLAMRPVNRDRLTEVNHRGGQAVHSAGYLLRKCPKYRWFLIECLLLLTGYDLNIAFLIDRVRELGGGTGLFGLLMAVIGFAEIPAALFFGAIRRRFRIEHLMFIMSVFTTARAIGTAFAGSPAVIVIAQLFEAFGMALYYPGAVYFIMKYVPAQDSVKGTSLLNITATGISAVISAVAAGAIMQVLGLQALMNVSCIVSGLAIAAGIVMLRARA